MAKKVKVAILVVIILLISISASIIYLNSKDKTELRTIKSRRELAQFLKVEDDKNEGIKLLKHLYTMPFSFFDVFDASSIVDIGSEVLMRSSSGSSSSSSSSSSSGSSSSTPKLDPSMIKPSSTSATDTSSSKSSSKSSNKSSESSSTQESKDYSTTNIQVENVDEADITKTDGDYIYSLSEDKVIITNVMDPSNIKIEAKIQPTDDDYIPVDLILYKDELIVISESIDKTLSNTKVEIYDITKRESPVVLKDYVLYEEYYTSRCINNKLYVISCGELRIEQNANRVVTYYHENNKKKNIELNRIKYLKDVKTKKQTLISIVNLDEPKNDVDVSSYLIDISNAYVSENSIYLLNNKYEVKNDDISIKSIFGAKGIIGLFTNEYDEDEEEDELTNTECTEIYKFDIKDDGKVNYNAKTKVAGKTINQYSLDELNGHLRIALYDKNGSRIMIFDENLKQIGISDYVAKGEKMYSSRFINDKVYFVTYKTVDPLFVMDLSDEENPTILGKLKIPGYSTYLHPYDENHIIGIGMETEEQTRRDFDGDIISSTSRIVGMKMALFDVSDVNNPKQISNTVIGDRRTTSAVLTNPKALLFSKEKNLIAIPVNNYEKDFYVEDEDETYSSVVDSYTKYNKNRIAEGYLVYNIDTENGFKLKGTITHEENENKKYSSYTKTRLLRGLYIDNNLYTISEKAVKVNELDTLKQICELELLENKTKTK